ncbi:MAG: VPS10 domain-containing protein [Longimicrobiales bacterium]
MRPTLRALSSLPLILTLAVPAAAQQIPTDALSQLSFRHIGPVGNRTTSIAGVEGDRFTYYAGAATGGVWKTEDAGIHWKPVFDDQPVHAIGALAVSSSDPAIVWVGTGETSIRSNVSLGNGVWKSTDAGETWAHMGLEGTGRIGKVLIHPSDPDIVYVASLGHSHGPSAQRGVYRTMDGGATWELVLHVDENTGAYEMLFDPTNPRKIIATMWQLDLKQWGRESGGPGSGMFMTRDAGDTWTRLEGSELPTKPVGKIGVCTSPDDPRRIYALIETGDGVPIHGEETDTGELWRTDDGGTTWSLVSYHHDLATRQAYYTRCGVASDDKDEVYFLSSGFSHSLDGGTTHTTSNFLGDKSSPGWDFHDIWIDPSNAERFALAFDGGVVITENRGASWYRIQLPIAQMYHVTADNAVPYNVLGNRQDGPSFRGPSNTRTGGLWANGIIPRGDWRAVGGGESGFATPDPTDPNIVWSSASGSGARGGIVVRHNVETGQFRNVEVWPMSTGGWPADGLRYRFQWTFPLLISPHDNNTIYVTSQVVHRTRNGGQSWDVISPDLTTNDLSKQGISGGLTPDNIGVEYCCVIYAFDESPVQEGVLWTGSNDGIVQVTRDDGATWTNVTDNIPNLPADGVVRSIDASRWDAAKAYITIEHHQVGDFAARAYKTDDYGESWTQITSGISNMPVDYTRYLLEDPVRPGLLYLGTETALYLSYDDGASWRTFMNNMPPAPFYGIFVQEHFNDLVLGTYGRGYWILDDLGPVQQLDAEVAASGAHLFETRDAYRFRPVTEPMITLEDWANGENPPNAASLNYWIGDDATESVKLRIENASGDVVRTMDGGTEPGVNRAWWDFQDEPGTQVKLWTKPLFANWFSMPDEGFRSGGRVGGMLQPPGTYTVTLVIDGEDAASQPLTVLKDPTSEGSLSDIRTQYTLMDEIRADQEGAAAAVNRIELIRKQIADIRTVVDETSNDTDEEFDAASSTLEEQLIEVESSLVQLKTTGGGDGVRWPAMLWGQLNYLRGAVGSADFRPTDQHGEVQVILRQQLRDAEEALEALLETAVQEYNRLVLARGLPPIIT